MKNINEALLKAFGLIEDEDELYSRIWATDVMPLSEHVGIRKVFNEQEGRLRLEVVIDSETNKKDIPSVWNAIEEQLRYLVNYQGSDLNDYFRIALNALETGNYVKMIPEKTNQPNLPPKYKIITTRPQYRDILMDANFDLAVFAIRASKGNDERANLADRCLRSLMRQYNYLDEEISEWRDKAIEEIRDGEFPDDIFDRPIDIERLKNKFEYLRKICKLNASSVSMSQSGLMELYQWFIQWGDWNEAAELLERKYETTFIKYQARLHGRTDEILKYSSQSVLGTE